MKGFGLSFMNSTELKLRTEFRDETIYQNYLLD